MDNDLYEEVISAAVDGERVDLRTLERALATGEGREALASFVLLRAATIADELEPNAPVYEATPALAPARPRRRLLAYPRLGWSVAASLVLIAVAGSFWLGTTWRVLPVPVQVIGPTNAETAVDTSPATQVSEATQPQTASTDQVPPTPVRRLQFVQGVDWRAGS